MSTLNLYGSRNSFDINLSNARHINEFISRYFYIKNKLSNTFRLGINAAKVILYILLIAFPLPIAVGLYFKYKRSQMMSKMNTERTVFLDTESYVLFKEKLSEIDKLRPTLEKINNYKQKDNLWVVSFLLSELKKTSITLLDYTSWLKETMYPYNNEFFLSDSNDFKNNNESELWDNRNKSYKYWI